MQWGKYWPESILLALIAAIYGSQWFWDTNASTPVKGAGWTAQRKWAAREKTRELWYHGFNNYMTYAFPMDELTPLSCSGQGPDWANPKNIAANDVAGNYSLTLIDVLDTFVVLDDRQGFEEAVKNVITWVSFDVNAKPQVFETTIRVLGGLLSGHIFANQTGQPFHLPWYRGELLALAHDLGKRLLPAFNTPTGLPYARINLRHGLMKGETRETCTAGAGSLILEFATLSRLTGDDRFEKAAYKAFFGIWNRKSEIGLVGNTINIFTGAWTSPEITGIGAGIDSFFEYALKWYVLSGEVEFLDVWEEAYTAIMRYSRATDGFWYRTVNMNTGDVAFFTVDSLSAFWPGLQVLAGDLQSAIRLHLMYYNIWREHSGLPEVFDTNFKRATSYQYPLRPEFIESTWYLYRATRDPFYLDVGERVLFDIITRAKVDCGLTGIQDLRTNKRDDRMESFALSETLKYLFLLFDEENPLHSDDSNYVFTTEGHIFSLGQEHLRPMSASRRKIGSIDTHQCPVYKPFVQVHDNHGEGTGLVKGVPYRGDVEYARHLVGLAPTQSDINTWSPYGWCEKPRADLFSYDFILSSHGNAVPEDLSPSLLKLGILPDGFVINNVTGIRMHIVRRLDGKGYDIRKLGHYTVRTSHIVYINDSALFTHMDVDQGTTWRADVLLRFYADDVDPMFQIQTGLKAETSNDLQALITGHTSHFGADIFATPQADKQPPRFSRSEGIPVNRDWESDPYGCGPYKHPHPDIILVVRRGHCTFLEKLVHARSAGAAGVIVVSEENFAINPTANHDEVEAAGDLSDVALVLLTQKPGQLLLDMLDRGLGNQVKMVVEDQWQTSRRDTGHVPAEKDPNRILYINGHPLLNTRLLV
ncbi:ER degradation-enhancing alpha-mannosidase-like protein 1 [Hypsizygus marmoreus]|uniref:alpha-1,2-Mannosidase n=1 Tax=Hypsizygus marmoreus TaxID=39966 RepID=A0A369JMQ0_HYPMA|nr:ER degradation-enhancing alpha-mannosidase-like protein 1 [Hypsizygus marmoreus]